MKKKRIILDEPTEKFLSNLKVLRQQRGLTQKQLAQELGLLRSIYQRYEAQNYLPRPSQIVRLTL